MELYNKPVQAADSGSSEAYSDQGMGECSGWPSSQGLVSSASSWYILTAGSRTRAMTSAESRMIF